MENVTGEPGTDPIRERLARHEHQKISHGDYGWDDVDWARNRAYAEADKILSLLGASPRPVSESEPEQSPTVKESFTVAPDYKMSPWVDTRIKERSGKPGCPTCDGYGWITIQGDAYRCAKCQKTVPVEPLAVPPGGQT